jgi:hypothetical protein
MTEHNTDFVAENTQENGRQQQLNNLIVNLLLSHNFLFKLSMENINLSKSGIVKNKVFKHL